jgi:hypothetical protein
MNLARQSPGSRAIRRYLRDSDAIYAMFLFSVLVYWTREAHARMKLCSKDTDIKDTEDPGMVTICKDERKYYTRIRSHCQRCYFGYQRKSSKENNWDRNFMMSWHRRHSTNKHELQNKINDKVAVSFFNGE